MAAFRTDGFDTGKDTPEVETRKWDRMGRARLGGEEGTLQYRLRTENRDTGVSKVHCLNNTKEAGWRVELPRSDLPVCA